MIYFSSFLHVSPEYLKYGGFHYSGVILPFFVGTSCHLEHVHRRIFFLNFFDLICGLMQEGCRKTILILKAVGFCEDQKLKKQKLAISNHHYPCLAIMLCSIYFHFHLCLINVFGIFIKNFGISSAYALYDKWLV